MADALDFEKPLLELENRIAELRADGGPHARGDEIARLEERLVRLRQRTYASLTAWQRTQLARHPKRPRTLDYVRLLIEEFVELHGDRVFGDDKAVVGGLGRFDGQSVVVLGHQKGRDTRENLARNFGMPHPEGYRKALRLMKLAEKFAKPVLTFIDTPGAYPGVGAEERGQGEAIARNLREMAGRRTPVIAVVIGEGGSGGALAIGVRRRPRPGAVREVPADRRLAGGEPTGRSGLTPPGRPSRARSGTGPGARPGWPRASAGPPRSR